ncbi:MAG: M20/M25/M40 family metallo-hydrolase [candidate division WOR-3 bacterium]|nr:MAG: M20/M25/M40 family metallo-hydrolase [candidate division WOR-3 bacterium]
MDYLDILLERLSCAIGIGYAGDVSKVIEGILNEEKVPVSVEKDGSVTAHLEGNGTGAVMLACHADEIGFIVSRIDDAGRIYFSEIGGADVRILPGQEVTVLGRKRYTGYVAVKPPHLVGKEEREVVPRSENLFIDIGLAPATVKRNVHLGDYICFAGRYGKMPDDLRTGKSLDNRASVACGLAVLRELVKAVPGPDVYFVATSQEEYTGLGARIHAFRLPVDYAIVVDVTHGEHPDLKEHDYFPLNKGPAIVRGATVPVRLFGLLLDTAKSLEIPYQIQPVPSGTATDADDIAFAREGIPTCVVNIPLRYMHTPVEIVSLKDIEYAVQLIVQVIKRVSLSDVR